MYLLVRQRDIVSTAKDKNIDLYANYWIVSDQQYSPSPYKCLWQLDLNYIIPLYLLMSVDPMWLIFHEEQHFFFSDY